VHTDNEIYYRLMITLMNVCQSCVLTPAKSPFFIKIFFMFDEKPVGNLIFFMTSLTILLCCSVKHQGRLIFCWWPSPLELMITLCNAWLASWMSLQIFPIFSLSVLPSNIHHNIFVMFFPICIVSNKWTICRCSYYGNLLNWIR
jgi:hypothetical protein